MDKLFEQIAAYTPFNPQEEKDKAEILRQLESCPLLFSRENAAAHMTASAWVTNPRRDRILMAYHNIYNSWSWLGGHADGERDLLGVALREVREESGLRHVLPVTPDIYSLEILTVDGHEKRGQYVSSHLHLNLTYLLEADDAEPLHNKPDENSAVAWYTPGSAVAASCEPWFQTRIYSKLNQKLALYPPREAQK